MAWWDWFRRKPVPPTPAPVPTPTPVPSPSAQVYGVATEQFSEVTAFNAQAGKKVNTFSIYQSFYWDKAFPTDLVKKINAGGYTPMITWEPWEPNGQSIQPKYSLARINAGDFDSIIKGWATSIKTLGFPILLRFAHEMNGDWYPWGTTNGNNSAQYIAAYKRVYTLFAAAGVANVHWVWSPNVDFPITPFYPGDTYVDYVAVDGYNWDTSSPEQVFGSTIDSIKALTSRPLFIGETGCPEYSGKPKWISDFFVMLKARSLVGFVWFNIKKEQDWRIESSVAAATAFRTGVSKL